MGEEGFFIRWRGQLKGPFGMEALRRMAAAGEISRLHDVSADRRNWTQAGQMAGVFPSSGPALAPAGAAPEGDWKLGAPAGEPGSPAERVIETAAQWYTERGGQVEGPKATAEVIQLIRDGMLGPADRVSSTKNPERWDYIRDTPELSGAAGIDRPPPGAGTGGLALEGADLAAKSLGRERKVAGFLGTVWGAACIGAAFWLRFGSIEAPVWLPLVAGLAGSVFLVLGVLTVVTAGRDFSDQERRL
ncbi:MAG TPA: hypothetical protein P5137_05980 [Candidatus Brocadiia bacterium]|nr:hypothetical protein [Candidatus Brocadiia bacterium]